MKLSKITITISLIIILVVTILIACFAYSVGQHNASLTVKQVTPKQIAEAMQSDNFYGEYTKTMLLVTGKIKAVTQQNTVTIAQFEVSSSPTALGKVSCDLGSDANVKTGDVIHVLSVAYDAQRQNIADVYMPRCYILK